MPSHTYSARLSVILLDLTLLSLATVPHATIPQGLETVDALLMVDTRCDQPNKRDGMLLALGAMKWLNTLRLQQFRDFDLETANAIAQVLPQQLTRFALSDGRAKRSAAPYWMAPGQQPLQRQKSKSKKHGRK